MNKYIIWVLAMILTTSITIANNPYVTLGSVKEYNNIDPIILGYSASGSFCSIKGCTMKGDINMDNFSIFNANWVNVSYSNVTINYTQLTDENFVNESGDTMTGNLTMESSHVRFDQNYGLLMEDGFGNPSVVFSVNNQNIVQLRSPQNAGYKFTSADGLTVPLFVDISGKKIDLFQDQIRLEFGLNSDVNLYWDDASTSFIINPRMFTTGKTKVIGELQASDGVDDTVSFNPTVSHPKLSIIDSVTGFDAKFQHLKTNDELYIGTDSSDAINFVTGNTQVMRMDTSQNIVISKNLNVTKDLNVKGNFTGNQIYAEMWGNHAGADLPIVSAGVYENITQYNDTKLNGFSYSNGVLTALVDGLYNLQVAISFSGGASNEYHVQGFINNTPQDNCELQRVMGTGGDVGSATITCFVNIGTNGFLTTEMENMDSTADATIHDINVNLIRIGDVR